MPQTLVLHSMEAVEELIRLTSAAVMLTKHAMAEGLCVQCRCVASSQVNRCTANFTGMSFATRAVHDSARTGHAHVKPRLTCQSAASVSAIFGEMLVLVT